MIYVYATLTWIFPPTIFCRGFIMLTQYREGRLQFCAIFKNGSIIAFESYTSHAVLWYFHFCLDQTCKVLALYKVFYQWLNITFCNPIPILDFSPLVSSLVVSPFSSQLYITSVFIFHLLVSLRKWKHFLCFLRFCSYL